MVCAVNEIGLVDPCYAVGGYRRYRFDCEDVLREREGLGIACIHGYTSGKIHRAYNQQSNLWKEDIISDCVWLRCSVSKKERIDAISARGESRRCFMCVLE